MIRFAIALAALLALGGVADAHKPIASKTSAGLYAHKHAAAARRYAASRGAFAAAGVARPAPWRGADPSYGPGTPLFRQLQRQGRCVMDEGYGRFSYCDTW